MRLALLGDHNTRRTHQRFGQPAGAGTNRIPIGPNWSHERYVRPVINATSVPTRANIVRHMEIAMGRGNRSLLRAGECSGARSVCRHGGQVGDASLSHRCGHEKCPQQGTSLMKPLLLAHLTTRPVAILTPPPRLHLPPQAPTKSFFPGWWVGGLALLGVPQRAQRLLAPLPPSPNSGCWISRVWLGVRGGRLAERSLQNRPNSAQQGSRSLRSWPPLNQGGVFRHKCAALWLEVLIAAPPFTPYPSSRYLGSP